MKVATLVIGACLIAPCADAHISDASDADLMAWRPRDPREFSETYDGLVAKARQAGIPAKRICFPNYCANTMVWIDTPRILLLEDVSLKSGLNRQEFCFISNALADGKSRRCWTSEGVIVDQTLDSDGWGDVATITENYPKP